MKLLGAIIVMGAGAVGALAQQAPQQAANPAQPSQQVDIPSPRPINNGPGQPENPAVGPPAAAKPAPETAPMLSSDAEVRAIQAMLVGSFASKGDDQNPPTPSLVWNAAAVNVAGLDNAVYFEVARADDRGAPFRNGVLHVMRRQGQVRLRMFEFAGQPTLKDAVVGLWLAPAAFPTISVDSLRPQLDFVPQAGTGPEAWIGATAGAVPTTRGGAVEMTSEIGLRPGTISVADRGIDGAGKQVWGPGPGKMTTFERTPAAGRAEVQPSGLTVITLVPPASGDSPRLVDGGTVVFHYSGYLPDGYVFDTSRQEGRQPFRVTVPANIPAGINQGLMGVGLGERRRVVIPSALGYGESGSRAGRVPPNSTLYLDVDCLMVEAPPAKAAPTPEQPAGAGGGAGK